MLLTLSTIMGIASFLAGILPLSFSLSARQLRIITLLGTGVLVGTSLIVIIPEGIETIYSATLKSHSYSTQRVIQPTVPSSRLQNGIRNSEAFPSWKRSDEAVDTNLLSGGAVKAPSVDIFGDKPPIEVSVKKTKDGKDKEKEKLEEAHPQKGDDDSTEGHKEGHTRVHAPEDEEDHKHAEHEDGSSPHAYIGVALILGYILMFLVDHVPETMSSSAPKYQPMHISLSNLHRGPHNASNLSLNGMASEVGTPLATPMPPHLQPKKTSATTIGLIVHACADGIALGASSTAPSTSLTRSEERRVGKECRN